MRSISYRMLIGMVILFILLIIIIVLVAGALLMSTGNAPEGEISGIYGIVAAIESVLVGIITAAAEWIEYVASLLSG
jgi:hypothetical protein